MIVPWMTTGGADKFNIDLVGQLKSQGWRTTVAATLPGDNRWASRMRAVASEAFILEDLLVPAEYPDFFRYIVNTRAPTAILLSNSTFAYHALPYLRRVAGSVPLVDFCHSIHPYWLDGGYPRLSVQQKDFLDLHIVSSDYVKRWMVNRGCDARRVEVCYTNVDAAGGVETPGEILARRRSARHADRHDLSIPGDSAVLIYPCRIDVEKQPRVFAETVRALHLRGVSFVSLVVGDGPYLEWLERFVRRNALEACVRFLGRLPNEDVRALIALSDCVFLPSQFEGISLAFFEALAEGVAVVGADVGGQRELITPACGVLVPRADEATEVREYTRVLADLLQRPDELARLGQAGLRRVREYFPLDQMGLRMNDLLQRAQQLAVERPARMPTPSEVERGVLQAVRGVLWAIPGAALPNAALSVRVRWMLFKAAATVGMPIQRLALRLGLHWVEAVRQRVAELLQPRPQ